MQVKQPTVGRQIKLRSGTTLFVPAHPQNDDAGLVLELRVVEQFGPTVLGFTTVTRLIDALGAYQPWVSVEAIWLDSYVRGAGVSLCVNPQIDPGLPRWTANDLAALIGGRS